MEGLEGLLRAFLCPDNELRRRAVQELEASQARGGDDLPLGLLHALRSAIAPDLRLLAAVLLRKVVNAEDSEKVARWTRITQVSRSIICSQLLMAVKEERVDIVRRRVCDTLAEVSLHVMADEPWDDLWKSIHGLISSHEHSMQEAGLLLCEMLGGYIAASMTTHLPSFRALFHQRLADSTVPRRVRTAAARAVGSILISLSARHSSADEFVGLVPDIVRCLLEARAARDSESAMSLVGILIDVADQQPQLLKPCLADLTRTLCGVALDVSGGTENDLRRLCFEVVVAVAGAMCFRT